MRARGSERGLARAVGDRGVQAAAPLAQRRALQADIWLVIMLISCSPSHMYILIT